MAMRTYGSGSAIADVFLFAIFAKYSMGLLFEGIFRVRLDLLTAICARDCMASYLEGLWAFTDELLALYLAVY